MTQITRKSAPERGLVFLLVLFLGAGLALTGCGGDDTTTTPAPAPPPPAPATPEPEPPAPEAPAAPTGLMVSGATETSVTWSWDAVEGAVAYAVQVSLDEMFDDSDTVTMTTETSHTQSGLEPETSVYVRVAAAAGTIEDPVRGTWTTHVTGMSAMPPPAPPPAPDPVMVTFTVPKGKLPLEPDTSMDKAKAVATVNRNITVTSNTTAVIEPMGFADGASPVSLNEGDNTPFKFVDWKAMQSQVVGDGVTFRITRQTLAANQEMMPTGDVAYVTCGPFECAAGMDAPDITTRNSAICAGWDPSMQLQVGVVEPQRMDGSTTIGPGTGPRPPGLDLGWVYTANTAFSVKHEFPTFSASGGDVEKGSDKALPAGRAPHPTATAPRPRRDITDSRNGSATATPGIRTVIDVDQPPAGADGCYPTIIGTNRALYTSASGSPKKPTNCFRLSSELAYLENYKVTLKPKGADVSWGSIPWDRFKDLTCPEVTFTATDQMEIGVCELLEEEVATLNRVEAFAQTVQPGGSGPFKLEGIDLFFVGVAGANQTAKRWNQLLYFDDTTASPTNDVQDLYSDWASTDRQDTPGRLVGKQISTNGPRNRWIPLLDENGNPRFGDIGKVDAAENVTGPGIRGGDDMADNFHTAVNPAARMCSAADGGTAKIPSQPGTGTLCDAVDVKIPTSVTFTDGMGFGCTVKKEYVLTCQWDATGGWTRTGERHTGVRSDPIPRALEALNWWAFLACKVAPK